MIASFQWKCDSYDCYDSIRGRCLETNAVFAKVSPGVLKDINACEAALLSTAKIHSAPSSSASPCCATLPLCPLWICWLNQVNRVNTSRPQLESASVRDLLAFPHSMVKARTVSYR